MMNVDDIKSILVENIQMNDYPDFVDAYISKASWKSSGNDLLAYEIDELNDYHSDFVQNCAYSQQFGTIL